MADIDGRWHIEAMTPMGKQTSVLDITVDGTSASGTLSGPDGEASAIVESSVAGAAVELAVRVEKPMAMKLNLSLAFDGDAVAGKVKAGIFPPARATGWRLAE